MATELVLPLILQLVGIAVIIAEFILPSGGALTIAALGAFGYSIYHVFKNVSTEAGVFFVVGDIILIPILIVIGMKILARTPVALATQLSSSSGVSSQDESHKQLLGKTGEVLSDLRPAGRALIEGKKYDVVSGGDYIERGSKIIVSQVNGNRIVVLIADDDNA